MSGNNENRLAKGLRWAGRIIILPVATFFFVFGVGDFIGTITTQGLQHVMEIGGLLGGVTILLTMVGAIISWWWLLPAGAMLIFAYLFGAISSGLVAIYHVGYLHWSQFRDFWSIPGILCLISGALFVLSWWIAEMTNHSALPPSSIS